MNNTKWKDIEVSSLQEYNQETHRLTIESIQQAMAQLLSEKSFREITIQELVKRAGVSRSAFYRNYQSKEEVMQSIVYDSFASLSSELAKTMKAPSARSMKKALQSLIEQARDLYIVEKADAWQGDTLLECMNRYFGDFIPEVFRGKDRDEMQMRFMMGGVYNAILYWLDTGMKESPEKLADRLWHYMTKD